MPLLYTFVPLQVSASVQINSNSDDIFFGRLDTVGKSCGIAKQSYFKDFGLTSPPD